MLPLIRRSRIVCEFDKIPKISPPPPPSFLFLIQPGSTRTAGAATRNRAWPQSAIRLGQEALDDTGR